MASSHNIRCGCSSWWVRPRQEAGRCSDSVAVPKPHLRHPSLGSISVVRELELELLLSLGATSTRPVFRRIGFYQRLGKKRLSGSLAVDDIDHDDSTTVCSWKSAGWRNGTGATRRKQTAAARAPSLHALMTMRKGREEGKEGVDDVPHQPKPPSKLSQDLIYTGFGC
uniref:Uncharacterized protein n=1 Tax=Oryza sativa subsp. japonica TaxID=39947 RepID=Q10M40_ORYSJ|nr:hypothetical protein LOC_Os03g20800 [Oryza sativa Japonica Group]